MRPATLGRESVVNVLVVEDEALVAILMQELVEDAGHDCVGPVASVGEARALIESQRVDAALLDIWLRNDEFVWPRRGSWRAGGCRSRSCRLGLGTGWSPSSPIGRCFPSR
jgi:hypothetical protein